MIEKASASGRDIMRKSKEKTETPNKLVSAEAKSMKDAKRSEPTGLERAEGASSGKRVRNRKQLESVDPREVLVELFGLLEEYAPIWYTDEHHNRALATLRALKGS
ncbi:MAG: hypothetical protein WBL63_04680 [Candidatus Acidiferrum sp.]